MTTKKILILASLFIILALVVIRKPNLATAPTKGGDSPSLLTSNAEVGDTYRLKPTESSLFWRGSKKIGDAHEGMVPIQDGIIVLDGETFVEAEFLLDIANVTCTDLAGAAKEKMEEHLRASDYFDTDQFPTAMLKVTSAEIVPNTNVDNVLLTADLTIKDITSEIIFPATITLADKQMSALASFTIDRNIWGIASDSSNLLDVAEDQILNDEIEFEVMIIAEKEE